MLEYINIKNIALIDKAEIFFGEGLNIITGETGTGKSMLIDSVNFALGGKADKGLVGKNGERAQVDLSFSAEGDKISRFLAENHIPADENLLITRILNENGRTINKINGISVTVSMLKELSGELMDIHGQHEHQSLIHKDRQQAVLDSFSGKEFKRKFDEFSEKYKRLMKIRRELSSFEGGDKAQRLDFINFQINEIEEAALKPNEDEILSERKKVLQNADKLVKLSGEAIDILYDGRENAADKIDKALSLLENIKDIDSSLGEGYAAVERASIELSEAMHDLKDYFNSLEVNPKELFSVEERLNLIYGLKRKYGSSTTEILSRLEELKKEKSEIEESYKNIDFLTMEKEKLEIDVKNLSREISRIRKKVSESLEKQIENELKSLEMKNAVFKIKIDRKEKISPAGEDDIEFLISPNLGEEPKPLSKIASGGEISRIMLALKNVLSAADDIDTFIFDEIDSGVSGRTAQKVAEKMSSIGQTKQILCITHLPQIAAMADRHFLIEKDVSGDKTVTTVKTLDRSGSVKELARLMGGAEITDVILDSAEEVKAQAEKIKGKI